MALARRVNVGGGREDSKETMFQEIWLSRSQRAEMEAGAEGKYEIKEVILQMGEISAHLSAS